MKSAMFLLAVSAGAGLIWFARHSSPAAYPALAVPDAPRFEEFSELSFFPVSARPH